MHGEKETGQQLNGKNKTEEAPKVSPQAKIDGRWQVNQDAVHDFDQGIADARAEGGNRRPADFPVF